MWQDWVNFVIGLWLLFSPWILGAANIEANYLVANGVITGILIAVFAFWSALARSMMWPVWIVLILCVWIFISPWVLQFTGPVITWNNMIVGVVAGILALWSMNDRKPAA